MAGKAAAMTPAKITEAGYSVFKMADVGNVEQSRKPWVIMTINTNVRSGGRFVLIRYATYGEAVGDLHLELTDPDGSLNPLEG